MSAPFSTATERDALCSYLDWTRDALIRKAGGLSEEDVRAASTVSSLSLLSLLKHSAIWERRWFQVIFDGRTFPGEWPEVKDDDEGATFELGDDDTVDSVLAYYLEQIAVSREIVATGDLDARCARTELVDENLRWVAMHLIQETARHARPRRHHPRGHRRQPRTLSSAAADLPVRGQAGGEEVLPGR